MRIPPAPQAHLFECLLLRRTGLGGVVLLEEVCHRGWALRSQKPMPGAVSIPLTPSFGGTWLSQAEAVGLPFCPKTNLQSRGAALGPTPIGLDLQTA